MNEKRSRFRQIEMKTYQKDRVSTIKDFEIMEKIGDGAYSHVFRARRLEDGQKYALKKVKLDHLSDKERDNAINEVRILASVKHPNVI